MPIVQEIRNEVRKLNTKNIIWEKITHLEKEMRMAAAVERLIAPLMDKVSEKRKDPKVRNQYQCNSISFVSLFFSRQHHQFPKEKIDHKQIIRVISKMWQVVIFQLMAF